MRENLFRGKSKKDGRWLYGSLLVYGNRCFIVPKEDPVESELNSRFYWRLIENHFEVDPETVGQYVGKCDKNGKKIFEGDIIRTALDGTERIEEIIFVSPMFSPRGVIKFSLHRDEVIGNVHDNPELLR